MPLTLRRVSRIYLLPIASLVAMLVLWEAACKVLNVPAFIVPTPVRHPCRELRHVSVSWTTAASR